MFYRIEKKLEADIEILQAFDDKIQTEYDNNPELGVQVLTRQIVKETIVHNNEIYDSEEHIYEDEIYNKKLSVDSYYLNEKAEQAECFVESLQDFVNNVAQRYINFYYQLFQKTQSDLKVVWNEGDNFIISWVSDEVTLDIKGMVIPVEESSKTPIEENSPARFSRLEKFTNDYQLPETYKLHSNIYDELNEILNYTELHKNISYDNLGNASLGFRLLNEDEEKFKSCVKYNVERFFEYLPFKVETDYFYELSRTEFEIIFNYSTKQPVCHLTFNKSSTVKVIFKNEAFNLRHLYFDLENSDDISVFKQFAKETLQPLLTVKEPNNTEKLILGIIEKYVENSTEEEEDDIHSKASWEDKGVDDEA